MWGWRSDRTEEVSGKECKVFSASNVELVTKTRTEHLSEQVPAGAPAGFGDVTNGWSGPMRTRQSSVIFPRLGTQENCNEIL